MKKLFYTVLTVLSVSFAANAQTIVKDWANFPRFEESNKEVIASGIKPKAVLMGDSITYLWDHRLPEFLKENNFIGRGIGGQVTAQMLVRFNNDVVELNPEYVVILGGINDIALNLGYVPVEDVVDNIISMAQIARANGIKVVLCSILPANTIFWRPVVENVAEKIDYVNTELRNYAKSHKGVQYLDYFSSMVDNELATIKEYTLDGVHPSDLGYEVMGKLLLKALK